MAKTSPTHPGTMKKSDWQKTNVHRATKWYGCAWCGARFADPTAVYSHLDKQHLKVSSAAGAR